MVIAYFGMPVDDHHHRHRGVAVVINERAVLAWRMAGSEFDSISERIIHIRLKSHTGFVSLLAVCTPTNEPGNEEEMVEFYELLQECLRQVPERDMLLIMGDFNARVGNDVASWRGTIGRFGPGEQNRHGEELLNFVC